MPANTSPIHILTPQGVFVNFATANTARDGTGTIATLYTAGANGGRVEKIRINAAGTTTAGVIRLFRKVSGGTFRLWREILVTAVTPSTTVETWSYEWKDADGDPLCIMAANDVLGVATNNAETFSAFSEGGDY